MANTANIRIIPAMMIAVSVGMAARLSLAMARLLSSNRSAGRGGPRELISKMFAHAPMSENHKKLIADAKHMRLIYLTGSPSLVTGGQIARWNLENGRKLTLYFVGRLLNIQFVFLTRTCLQMKSAQANWHDKKSNSNCARKMRRQNYSGA